VLVDSTRRKSLIRWQKRAAVREHGFEERRGDLALRPNRATRGQNPGLVCVSEGWHNTTATLGAAVFQLHLPPFDLDRQVI